MRPPDLQAPPPRRLRHPLPARPGLGLPDGRRVHPPAGRRLLSEDRRPRPRRPHAAADQGPRRAPRCCRSIRRCAPSSRARESAWYPWLLGTDFMQRNRRDLRPPLPARPPADRRPRPADGGARLPLGARPLRPGGRNGGARLLRLQPDADRPLAPRHRGRGRRHASCCWRSTSSIAGPWQPTPGAAPRRRPRPGPRAARQDARRSCSIRSSSCCVLVLLARRRDARRAPRRLAAARSPRWSCSASSCSTRAISSRGRAGRWDRSIFQSRFLKGIAAHLPDRLPVPAPGALPRRVRRRAARRRVGASSPTTSSAAGRARGRRSTTWSAFLFKTPLPLLAACLLAPFVRLRADAPR